MSGSVENGDNLAIPIGKGNSADARSSSTCEPTAPAMNKEAQLGPEPVDKYNFAYIIMLLHGIGTLIPWSAFITIAFNYYVELKLLEKDGSSTYYAKEFMGFVTMASQIPNILLNFFNLFFTFRGGLAVRIYFSIAAVFATIVATMAFIYVDTSTWIAGFFWMTLFVVIAMNAANGVYQNSLYGIAADLPANIIAAIQIGNNACGWFLALVLIIIKATKTSRQTTALLFFSIAALTVIACGLSFIIFLNLPYYKYFAKKAEMNRPTDTTDMSALERKDTMKELWAKCKTYVDVMKTGNVQFVNVFLSLFVTLAIFPSIQAEVKPSPSYIFNPDYFADIFSMFSFGFWAMIGALISNWWHWPSPKYLICCTAGRLIFIPFFLMCNYRPKTRTFPVWIRSDVVFIIGGILMALTSGYFCSIAMIYAPRVVEPAKSRSAGMLAAFFLVLGIGCGIAVTFLESFIMEHAGPLQPIKSA